MSYADYISANDPIVWSRRLRAQMASEAEQAQATLQQLDQRVVHMVELGMAVAILLEELDLIRSVAGLS